MTKPSSPNDLVDRYLQAVRFWLPKTEAQHELLAELGEDLRSQIDAREEETGRPLTTDETAAILKRCGSPMVVASRMGPKKSLIGPALYPIYIFVMKMVLLWILLPVFLFIVSPVNVANSGGDWARGIAATFAQLWSGLFVAAGIVTLVFAILERSHVHGQIACKFDPLSLPPVQKTERKPSIVVSISQLGFAAFGLVWLLLLPDYPVLILGPAAAFLKAAPLWHSYFVPLVVLGVIAILRPAITLARPQWTVFPAAAELAQAVLTLILVNFLLNVSGQTSHGEWHPFVMLADSVTNSTQYMRVAALVNVSILVSLVCAWFGLAISVLVSAWRLIRHLRRSRTGGGLTEPVQAH